ncbi:hypothetical protein C8J56DRAFT_43397 [Mycena floridula]|nr:hypothetical protein C8J56DRAFT_43397 [Mycena floridula]
MTFPIELYSRIIMCVEDDICPLNFTKVDICSLRLANKMCNELASPAAFRKIRLLSDPRGLYHLSKIQASPNIAKLVRSVEFHYEDIGPDGDRDGRITDSEVLNQVDVVFGNLAKLTTLESLSLAFYDEYDDNDGYDFTGVSLGHQFQSGVLGHIILNSIPPSLSSLSLINLMSDKTPLYTHEGFVRLVSQLKTLIVWTISSEYTDEFTQFWEISVPKGILSESPNLTTLSLRGDSKTWPDSFRYTAQAPIFPNLINLALKAIIFAQNGLEAFILCHKESLTHLELHDCPMSFGEDPLPARRQWHMVYQAFEDGLSRLLSFDQRPQDFDGKLRGENYVTGEEGEYDTFNFEMEDDDMFYEILRQDREALTQFKAAVASRFTKSKIV